MKSYFYSLLAKYCSVIIQPECSVIELSPQHTLLIDELNAAQKSVYIKDFNSQDVKKHLSPRLDFIRDINEISRKRPDFLLLNGNLHYENDIQKALETIKEHCSDNTRLIAIYYNNLWRPLINLATRFGLRHKTPESNWIAHEDIDNLCKLAGFEIIKRHHHILIPFFIPLLSTLLNQYLAYLPFFRWFTMLTIASIRPLNHNSSQNNLSVSVIVPVRNESGNIEKILKRTPRMGPDDEIIFVEGGSSDNSWETIQTMATRFASEKTISCIRQDGRGKGDAVRKGFDNASRDILMILDADISVEPEQLTKFYKAIIQNKGELIIGSRLVYPMHPGAMRFLNIIGNKFFAAAFSFVLDQQFKDTLCGIKVLSRSNYEIIKRNRSFFGNFDPFGDFDLIFGAARAGLKICEIPVPYHERTYGITNIKRWTQGYLLLRMLVFAAKKVKFI